MRLWTTDWNLFFDLHMQICVPPNIDLICGLVSIFLCGLLTTSLRGYRVFIIVSEKNQFIQVCLNFFTFNTAVVMAVWAGQNFKWSKI